MKLRNKKSGVIMHAYPIIRICANEPDICYPSITELNEDWEDYTPKEPLIKDEKIRKAVRTWAEAESIPPEETLFYNGEEYSFGWYKCEIMFSKPIQELKEREYTIAELCGEEE